MNFGEHPEQTVLRELYEETGLHGTIRRLLDVRSHVFPAWREHGPLQAVQFIYEVEASGTPRVMEEAGSTVEAAWIPLAEMGVLPLVQLVVETQELIG